MRKIFIILCCGLLLLTCGCGQKDEVTTTVNTVKTASEIIKTEEENPPTESQPTETSSAVTTTTTEKEKEVESATISTAESKPPTTPPKTETTVTEKLKPTENTSSAAQSTEPPPTKEIYNTQIEVNPADIEKLVVQYINEYRVAQGDTAATVLTGLTEVARIRATELVTNFAHTDGRTACGALKYGEYVDLTPYGLEESDNYYLGYNREAIGKGSWFGTAESMAHRIADGFYNSKNHWRYVGSSEYCYIAVGVVHENNNWYVCVCMSHTNYGG